MQVEAVRTPATPQQVYSALLAQWPGSVGGTPTHDALVILTSQISLETSFNKIWNNNPGNLAGTKGDYVMLHAYTGEYRPYRAFDSLDEGVAAYLGLLAVRYAAAIQSAMTGDLSGFAANLKAKGYYEESEASYLAGLESRYAALKAQLAGYAGGAPEPTPVPPVPAPEPSAVPLLIASAIWGIALGGAAHYLFPPRRYARRAARRRYA